MIKVLVLCDHPMKVFGIKSLLSQSHHTLNFSFAGQSKNSLELINKAKILKPRVILIDQSDSLIQTLETAQNIRKHCPQSQMLVYVYESTSKPEIMFSILQNNIQAVLSNLSRPERLLDAIESLEAGQPFYDTEIWKDTHFEPEQMNEDIERYQSLRPREREVLKLLAQNYSNSDIANKLFISSRTVETYRSQIIKKMKVKSPFALIRPGLAQALADTTVNEKN